MPSEVTPARVSTLSEFTSFVEDELGPNKWYRGVGDSDKHKLVPSLYRHPELTEPEDLLQCEANLIERFRQRSLPYRDRSLSYDDNCDLLFLMQHHGVPTRLLDWTENPFFGLYFALTSVKPDTPGEEGQYQTEAAVWVLDSFEWNRKALQGGYRRL